MTVMDKSTLVSTDLMYIIQRIFNKLLAKENVQFQKISILTPQKGLEFPGGWVVLEEPKIERNV